MELLSLVKTTNFIQHSLDHFFFLEDPKPKILLKCIDEATTDLAYNILTYFLKTPSAINATINYYVAPCMDLTTPTQSPTQPSPSFSRLPSLSPPLPSSPTPITNEVPMNTQARAFLTSRQLQQSSSIVSTSITKLPPIVTRSSGAPTPTIADPSSNTTLFRYVNDPIFKSIRPYFYRISENARKRESGFNTPATQCTVCMQFFTKLNQHTSNSDSITGCYNVARLRMYICHRKNIPLPTNTLPSALAHPTVPKLESYLMELN